MQVRSSCWQVDVATAMARQSSFATVSTICLEFYVLPLLTAHVDNAVCASDKRLALAAPTKVTTTGKRRNNFMVACILKTVKQLEMRGNEKRQEAALI